MGRLDAHRTWLLYQGALAPAHATGWTVAAVYFVREVGMGPFELVLAGTALAGQSGSTEPSRSLV